MTRTFLVSFIGVCAAATLGAHHSMSTEFDISRAIEVKGDQTSPAPSEPPTPALNPGRMFWLWWKTLSGSYVVFTSTRRS
jgi:hypothetical protein